MEPYYRTNAELAEAYCGIAAILHKSKSGYQMARKRVNIIHDCPLDIPKFFHRAGSLEKLTINGIGSVTLGVLDDLLNRGEDRVREECIARR